MLIKQNLSMEKKIKDIIIVGAGGFGREIKFLIDNINKIEKQFNIIGFVDDNLEKGQIINGIEVIGNLNTLLEIKKPISVVLGIGDPVVKKKIIAEIGNSDFNFPNLIHPNVIIGNDDVSLGVGNVICAGNIITCNIKIKNFVTLNLSCTVGHDTIINDFASFMPSVNISGEVLINECVYVGTGAKIINQLEIGENSIVGAGAVVSKSLPSNCTAVGIPAKPIKFH